MNEDTQTIKATAGQGIPHTVIPGLTSIIMPIFNYDYSLVHYTGNALGSIKEHTNKETTPYEILLVDNGSPIKFDNPADYRVDKYIKNEENEGVTKAWNKGIRISQGEYICLINNDVMVFNFWLADLLEALEHTDLVMATPMYGEPFSRAVEAKAKREQWLGKPITESFSDFRDFSCILTKRKLFDEIGNFDEQFFNYVSDTDFLRRMIEVGKTYKSTQRVPIFHIIGATSTGMTETAEQMNQDKRKYEEKWRKEVRQVDEQQQAQGQVPPPAPHPNPSPPVPEVQPEPEYTIENVPALIRTAETGDRVFFVKDKETHWIINPEVLAALGFGFDDVKQIKRELYIQLTIGEPINMFNYGKFKEEISEGLSTQSSPQPASGQMNEQTGSGGQ